MALTLVNTYSTSDVNLTNLMQSVDKDRVVGVSLSEYTTTTVPDTTTTIPQTTTTIPAPEYPHPIIALAVVLIAGVAAYHANKPVGR